MNILSSSLNFHKLGHSFKQVTKQILRIKLSLREHTINNIYYSLHSLTKISYLIEIPF